MILASLTIVERSRLAYIEWQKEDTEPNRIAFINASRYYIYKVAWIYINHYFSLLPKRDKRELAISMVADAYSSLPRINRKRNYKSTMSYIGRIIQTKIWRLHYDTKAQKRTGEIVSLNKTFPLKGDMHYQKSTLLDTIIAEDKKDYFGKLLNTLCLHYNIPDKNKSIIHDHFYLGYTFEEIGVKNKTTKQNVDLIYKRFFSRIRKSKSGFSKELKELLNDR